MLSAGSGPRASMPSADERCDGGRDDRQVLLAHGAVLAGMRIEAGDGEPRPRNAEAAAAGRAPRCARSRRSGRWSAWPSTSFSGRWMVTGTTASSGDHSSMTGWRARRSAPRRAARDIRCGRDRRSRSGRARSWRPGWSRPRPRAAADIGDRALDGGDRRRRARSRRAGPGVAVTATPMSTTGKAD